MTKRFNIEVDCPNCAAKIETALNGLPGVNRASVNFVTQKMILDAEESAFPGILDECLRAGRKVEPEFQIEF